MLPLLLLSSPDRLQIPSASLWLLGIGLVLALLLVAFGLVLVRRHWQLLRALARRADMLLAARLPRIWSFIKDRFSSDAWYGLALTVSAGLVIGGLVLFVVITDSWVDQEELYAVDRTVNRLLNDALSARAADGIMTLTHLGDVLTALGLSALLAGWFLVRRYWWRLLALLLAMGAGQGVLWLLKALFGRPRPETRYYTPEGASFPSGHSFTATVLYGFCIFLAWRHVPQRPVRIGLTGLLTLLILVVCISRLLLGVHWVSDVLGGLTLGMAWLTFSLIATRSLRAYWQG